MAVERDFYSVRINQFIDPLVIWKVPFHHKTVDQHHVRKLPFTIDRFPINRSHLDDAIRVMGWEGQRGPVRSTPCGRQEYRFVPGPHYQNGTSSASLDHYSRRHPVGPGQTGRQPEADFGTAMGMEMRNGYCIAALTPRWSGGLVNLWIGEGKYLDVPEKEL